MRMPNIFKNKVCLIFFVLVFLGSCSTSENVIILDQTSSFKLPENSKIRTILQTDVDYFQSMFPVKLNNKMALYKMIQSTNYQLYIGIAIDAGFDEIYTELNSNSENILMRSEAYSPKCKSIFIQIDSLRYSYQYLKELEQGDKYLFLAVSKDKNLLDSLSKSDFIGKNIINE